MPHYRDDRPHCKQPPDAHSSGRTFIRLAWFDATEDPLSVPNHRNEQERTTRPTNRGYKEFELLGGRLWWRDWASGETGFVDAEARRATAEPALDRPGAEGAVSRKPLRGDA